MTCNYYKRISKFSCAHFRNFSFKGCYYNVNGYSFGAKFNGYPFDLALGCYYNGIGFSYGANFTSPFDKCDSCICLGGDVICEPISCNVQCSAPYHPPGECCPQCTGMREALLHILCGNYAED